MLKFLYAGCFGLSSGMWSQFAHKVCAAAKNCGKFTKTPSFGVQGRSRSLKNLKSLSLLLVITNSMFVPISNRFHTKRANSGKIASFRGYPSLTPSFDGNSRTQGHEILPQ